MRMNVFDQSTQAPGKNEMHKGQQQKAVREKPTLSPEQIRQKVAENMKSKNLPATEAKVIESKPQPASVVEVGKTKIPTIEEAAAAETIAPPSVSLINDPKAPETQEKLKHLISTGAFNFSEKERKVLGEVLKS